jgi:hypothetical protein
MSFISIENPLKFNGTYFEISTDLHKNIFIKPNKSFQQHFSFTKKIQEIIFTLYIYQSSITRISYLHFIPEKKQHRKPFQH